MKHHTNMSQPTQASMRASMQASTPLSLRGRNKLRNNLLLSACCMISAMSLSTFASAQENANQTNVIDEVIVTGVGTKTDTDVLEIPQSISVVTADEFIDRGAVNFQDIFRYSAGVVTETIGVDTRGDFFGARGFSTQQFLDGLNRAPDFLYGARLEVFTLERAEILRGPSGVLYGGGSPGGLFNAVSKTPHQEFGGEIDIVIGTDKRKEVKLDVTGGLSDTVAARFVGVVKQGELQPKGQDDDRVLLMPSISWSPTDDTDLTFLALYQKDDLGTQTYLPLEFTAEAASDAVRLPSDFFVGEDGFNHMDMEHISGTIMADHRINDKISISNRTRYFDQKTDYAEVYGSPTGGTTLSREFYVLKEDYQVLNSDSHVQFNTDTGAFSHEILLGVDYTTFAQDRAEGFSCAGYEFAPCFAGPGPDDLQLNNPVYDPDFAFGFSSTPYTTRSTQLGFYLQDQINYGERVSFVFGIRRDRATSKRDGAKEDPNHATTIKAGTIFDLGNGFSPYVSYSESFQPVFGGDFYGNLYKPQEAQQYEAGLKWQPTPDALVTLAVYDIKETNFLTSDPANLQNFLQSGKKGAKGFEIEANANLFEGFNVNVAYSYTDHEVLEDNGGLQGLPFENTPNHLASIWGVKSLTMNDWNFRIGGGARYTGSKLDALSIYETDSNLVVDALLEAERDSWGISLNVTNLFDKQYYAYCDKTRGTGTCYPAMDRRAMVTLRKRF